MPSITFSMVTSGDDVVLASAVLTKSSASGLTLITLFLKTKYEQVTHKYIHSNKCLIHKKAFPTTFYFKLKSIIKT